MPAYLKDNEDFRSRYATETAGMPTNLAAIASRNLAAEDAGIAKVNAVARLLPQQPDYSLTPPSDSVAPVSTGTSISDLHTDDIATRRAAIDDQKKEIMARLGIIKPADAGLAAVVLAAPHERKDLLGNLAVLEHESDNLLREHHYNAIDSARTAHENFTRQNHITAANDFAEMANELNDLHKNTKPGTPEFAAGTLDIAKRHPAGFQTQAGQTLFRGVTGLHDKAAELEDRSYWQRFGQAFKEASQVAKKRGVDVQYDEQGFPSTALTASTDSTASGTAEVPSNVQTRYAKLTAAIQKHQEDSAAEEAQNKSSNQPNVPYSKASDYHAAKTELSLLEKQFPGLSAGETSGAEPAVGAPPPNITPEEHAKLKSGQKFWWNGQQLTKK